MEFVFEPVKLVDKIGQKWKISNCTSMRGEKQYTKHYKKREHTKYKAKHSKNKTNTERIIKKNTKQLIRT
jgi:hypothetical protein